ncbi:MAG: tetratricopeptide repeat protein [Acidobacteria bacterium]|nr:tetratricopeptide repeat protein [Acidobacteriota bacterium]
MFYLLATLLLAQAAPRAAQDVDPGIKSVVDRFFETQQAEDVQGYLRLWTAAVRPTAEQLKFIFDSGDDKFLDIVIVRSAVVGEAARVRVTATRVRTDVRMKNPDGSPRMFSTSLQLALSLVREGGDWKIRREGAPVDELAAALADTNDPTARKALLESDPELLNVRLVEAIGRHADGLARMSNFRAAQAIYERGLEVAQAIGDRKAEGQALQNIANSLYFQRDFQGALNLYARRLAVEHEISNDEGIASALVGMATIRYSTYEYGAALESYREALAIQERLDDSVLVSTTLISTGNVLYLQGDYEAAIADYRRAEAIKRQYFDPGGAATALEGLGRVYSAQGNYAAALSAFAGVLGERRTQKDVPRQALVLQSIGEIHFQLGNTDQARASFDESRKHFDTVKDIAAAGRVLQGSALTELVAGRFSVGEKAYAESISLCTRATDRECVARAQVGLAFALAAQQKYDDATTWYGRSLISFHALAMEDAGARARVGLAEALYGKGEYSKALDEAVNARRTGAALASDDLLWRALVSQARAERKLERPTEAVGTARAALQAVQRMAAAALDRPGQAVPRETSMAYATLAVLQAESGDGGAALTTGEQMRAHTLRISLATNERDIARGMTADERTQERALASELTTLLAMRDRQKALPKPDTARIDTLSAAITDVAARRTAARQQLFSRLPDLQTWRGLGADASAEQLNALLDVPGKVLLQFVVDEHDVVVITALRPGNDRPIEVVGHAVAIERQALAERIARALEGKSLSNVEEWRKVSAELFQVLPKDAVERLTAAKSIIVIPDDVLWRVPFEAMPIGTEYLADRAVVTYATSVTAAAGLPDAPARDPEIPVIAVHSPDVPLQVVENLKGTAPSWVIRAQESVAGEIARISDGLRDPPVILLTGPEATKAKLVATVAARGGGTPGALHVAAPFRVNSSGPLFSPILLADGSPGAESVPGSELEVRELFTLEPLASVVMFSDPATLSKRDAAAAVAPVHWAWRAAGATTLILKRWGGEEAASAEIVVKYYEQLRAGKSAVDALHAARAGVRDTAAGHAPAAWAGWLVLSGR